MSDGIKIRELDPTTTVSPTDVLVIDKDSFGDNSLTYHIEYQNFRESIFTGDINLDGSISATGNISAGGDLVVSGDTTLQNTVNVNSDLNVTGTLSTNTLYVGATTNLELDDLNDVDVSGATDKHFLMYDGTQWTSSLIDLDSIGGGGGTQGDDFILLSGGEDPITFYVQVKTKSTWNQFYGTGSTDCFWIGTSPDDLHESPILMLPPNREFIFNQSHPSNASRAMAFFDTQSESNFGFNNPSIGPGVGQPTGVPGITGAQTTLKFTSNFNPSNQTLSEQTPYVLYYRCSISSNDTKYMGSVVHNLGAVYKPDVGNVPYLGNDTFPGAMNLLESLQDLNTRLETLESSS